MKKLLFLAGILISLQPAFAQRTSTHKISQSHTTDKIFSAQKTTATDVLVPQSFTTCDAALYGTDQGGFISGVNGYGDLQKTMTYYLQEYGMVAPATIDTVYTLFGWKEGPGTATVTAKLYQKTATGLGTLLGTSAPKTVANCDTTGNFTKFYFNTPVAIPSDSFVVTIDFSNCYTTGDTLALIQTEDPCAAVNPLQSGEVWDDNTYHYMADPNNWDMAMDMAIFPKVTGSTAIKNLAASQLQVKVYPQPSTSVLNVSFIAEISGAMTISLADLTGKIITSQQIKVSKGKGYHTPINTSQLPAGVYLLQLSTSNHKAAVKVTVQ